MDEESVPCRNDPEADSCICTPPCDVVCVFDGCTNWGTILMPAELIFGSENGRLLKSDWGAGDMNELLNRGGWDTWICGEHDL